MQDHAKQQQIDGTIAQKTKDVRSLFMEAVMGTTIITRVKLIVIRLVSVKNIRHVLLLMERLMKMVTILKLIAINVDVEEEKLFALKRDVQIVRVHQILGSAWLMVQDGTLINIQKLAKNLSMEDVEEMKIIMAMKGIASTLVGKKSA